MHSHSKYNASVFKEQLQPSPQIFYATFAGCLKILKWNQNKIYSGNSATKVIVLEQQLSKSNFVKSSLTHHHGIFLRLVISEHLPTLSESLFHINIVNNLADLKTGFAFVAGDKRIKDLWLLKVRPLLSPVLELPCLSHY